nr:hypothetical protein [Tanacetum cinerariifolium]
GGNGGNQFRQYAGQNAGNLNGYNKVQNVRNQLLIAQKEEAEIQLQAKEFDLMVAIVDLDEIEEVNANCILMVNLQQASTSSTQTDRAPVYDSNGSVKRPEKIKDGLGYNAVPPPTADLYLYPKKDLSWTGLPEFVDDTVTDYSRPTPTVE